MTSINSFRELRVSAVLTWAVVEEITMVVLNEDGDD